MPIEQQELTAAVEKQIKQLRRVHTDIHLYCIRRYDGGKTRLAFNTAASSIQTAINELGIAWASATSERGERGED
jgi:hypothetical protein